MSSLPLQIKRVGVPPIKCQGIKTKLVPFILSQIQWQVQPHSIWIEPFLGSGVVAFNLQPERALLTDTNQHIIAVYQAIQQQRITGAIAREFLICEGEKLSEIGATYYYQVRERFNRTGSPLDFLFLNRSCFNGLIRFNGDGRFNVPFCRKPQRFSQSYITKITNQVDWAARQMAGKDWEFRVAPWQEILQHAKSEDFVYLDPPYIGRHTDYYNAWDHLEAEKLAAVTKTLPSGFAASMWLENQYRKNLHVQTCWSELEMRVCHHFYHVGSKEIWRGEIAEALLIKPGYATNELKIEDLRLKIED
ncbi:MAG: Dam family site-specific DNA-(adenine-N6)-methyltransferase [Leptolyngbyaceae cyanobacterium RU_5_1]|nr:Dam family site-specific DNA-(adenine-N6)-methyltransferase [Leptolyngbyaceae cyanobacterium RU_5_1]